MRRVGIIKLNNEQLPILCRQWEVCVCVFQLHFSTNHGSLLISLLDPNMAFEMMKGTFTNVLPMIVIGGWINWTFAGFITSEWSISYAYLEEKDLFYS